jgi:hypothetical protein
MPVRSERLLNTSVPGVAGDGPAFIRAQMTAQVLFAGRPPQERPPSRSRATPPRMPRSASGTSLTWLLFIGGARGAGSTMTGRRSPCRRRKLVAGITSSGARDFGRTFLPLFPPGVSDFPQFVCNLERGHSRFGWSSLAAGISVRIRPHPGGRVLQCRGH